MTAVPRSLECIDDVRLLLRLVKPDDADYVRYRRTKANVPKGVTIGDNCVTGAYSVVTRDIPANGLAADDPARVLRAIEGQG